MFKELFDFIVFKLKQIVTSRLFPVTLLFILLFSLLAGRMYRLQVVEGDLAQQNVEEIVTRTLVLSPTRGRIYDRNGKLLAYNELIQNVVVSDDGSYANGYQRNEMLLRLIAILDRFGEEVKPSFDIYYDEKGNLKENFPSENARLRFLRDMYGRSSVSQLSDLEMRTTPRQIVDYYADKFGVGVDEEGNPYEIDPQTALKLIYIRYSMYANYYMRYIVSVVAEDVKQETVAAIREHQGELLGVDIAKDTRRVYNDSYYFCHILGYTGSASTEEIESLNAQGGEYYAGNIVGKTGIEASMELVLHGKSGHQTVNVNNLGQLKQVASVVEAVAGDDIYLSIDADLQKGIYFLLEQKLAGILINHLVEELPETEDEVQEKVNQKELIPIRLAYFQLINNNVVDMNHFSQGLTDSAERRIYQVFSARQNELLSDLERQLTGIDPVAYKDMNEEMQTYYTKLYNVLLSENILTRERIDTDSALYKQYRQEGSISLQTFLRGALEEEWIDLTSLDLGGTYSSMEEVYRTLVAYILEHLRDSDSFSKEIYRNLVEQDQISRCDIALTMFEQGVIRPDPLYQYRLLQDSPRTAFNFLKDKLYNVEITPAQLALDPYSASATVVDVANGQVLAMVSYPGYDTNRIYEGGYYGSLVNDQSSPLFNSATQSRTAPGSSFKLVTSAAALEEGLISPDARLETQGIFSAAGMEVKCWVYPDDHGEINVCEALMYSCNDFFARMGYELALKNGSYSDSYGMEKLEKYARLLGLGEKSGVEITEYEPVISNTSALTSAIGQGTNLFACSHLARYVTTIATRGNIYDLTLLDRRYTAAGDLVQSYRGELASKTLLHSSTWDAIWEGMRLVLAEGGISDIWTEHVAAAGKTGTAEENELRPDHATFVSFGPYENPKVSVAVTIPNGYTSGNAAELGSYIYDYYFGYISMDDILSGGARDRGGNSINE